MRRRRFLAIAAASLIPLRAGAEAMHWQAPALGGTVTVTLTGAARENAGLSDRIAALIDEVEEAASLFCPGSALSRLNRAGGMADPPPMLRDLLFWADKIHALTGGCFDPTVQPLWQALAEGRDPGPARRLIGWPGLAPEGGIRLRPGQRLTLNGIAQGYAADRVRALLAAEGYGQALIDLGEFAALGGPFTLGIEDPAFGQLATRRLTGGAIATSSPGAMQLGQAGHILGPQGQVPLWSTVSVEAESAVLADGLSTAFCLMPETAQRRLFHAGIGLRRVLAVNPDGDVSTWDRA